MNISFQRLLEILMEEKGFLDHQLYDIATLSRKSEIGYQVIKNVLDGKTLNPSFLTLQALAHTLGVSTSYFEAQTEVEARYLIQRATTETIDPEATRLALRISQLSSSARIDLMHLLEHIEASERAKAQHHLQAICIDDDQGSLLIMRGTLEDSNIRHEWYRNPKEGQERILEGEFDLGFVDIMMPEISGNDIAHEVRHNPRSRKRDMVLVAVTAYAVTEQQQQEIYKAGFDEIIPKPFDPLQFPAWFAVMQQKYRHRL